MGPYRFNILNNIIWAFVTAMSIALTQPTTLFPKPCGIFNSSLPFNSSHTKYIITFIYLSIIFVKFSFFYSLLNRFAYAKPNFYDFIYRKYKVITYLSMITINIGLMIFVTSLIYIFSPNDEQEMIREFKAQNPEISINGRSVFCAYRNKWYPLLMFFPTAIFFTLCVIAFIVVFKLYNIVYACNTVYVGHRTCHMQVTLKSFEIL